MVDYAKELEIRYESVPVRLLPGCIIKVCIEFYWHDRMLKGQSVYVSESRHGLISLTANRRGSFSSPGAFFQINDAAGFFRFRIFSRKEEGLSVNPPFSSRFDLPRIMSAGGEDISRTARKKRSEDMIETRQYFPGDDIRRLNWKTFAHLGELFIRQGEELPDPDCDLIIIPDFSGAAASGLDAGVLSSYLDYLVSALAGIIGHLQDSGVNIRVILPNEYAPGDSINSFLPGMWWSEEAVDLKLSSTRRSSYLVVSSAFSNRAENICTKLSKAGRPVNAVVPVPEMPAPHLKPGRLHRFIFAGSGPEPQIYPEALRSGAESLISKLGPAAGGGYASVI